MRHIDAGHVISPLGNGHGLFAAGAIALAVVASGVVATAHAGGCNRGCPADLDESGTVDGGDLGLLLADWNQAGTCADLDGSGSVDGGDLGLLLAAWGACPGQGCPGADDCCFAHATSGCDDTACCEAICSSDPSCCDAQWDQDCVDAAVALCIVCANGCPASGDCCQTHATPACNDDACCDAVCFADPFCCDSQWDQGCVDAATSLCIVCDNGCPALGDCCSPHGNPGCSDNACCDSVCSADPSCCDIGWDQDCADVAGVFCRICATGCPTFGDCCTAHASPGCDDSACCQAVCSGDPTCCDIAWDQNCASDAQALCAQCRGATCPASGDCCTAHATPGCDNANCCGSICFNDPACCEIAWDQQCADSANVVCGVCDSGCPGAGDCCTPHPGGGCNDVSCCEQVCSSDPTCCSVSWDQSCADQAGNICDECGGGCPGPGDCCVVHASTGCNVLSCCESVCFTDLACCEAGWDQQCVDIAESVCDICP